jgi:NAD(P)-dependent dehydrogenase (short-subunit alcohol dehydrogenase family)
MQTMTTEHPRVVIVTGGSGGIGSEVAQRLARDGMSVVVAYAGRKAPAEEVVTAIVEAGGMATSFQGDVAEESDVAALFDAAELSYGGVDQISKKLADLAPPDQDPAEVARAIVRVVGMSKGTRPFRLHIDPADDGAETVNRVGDLVRREFYRRIGLDDLLTPARSA